ncbi:unnamed protein product, partial [Chrysoparadoxa australica]
YLTVRPPVDRDYPVVLRVIDEKFWPTLARTFHLSIEDLMRPPSISFPKSLHDTLARTKAAIIDGLQRNLPLHEHLRKSGINTEQLLDFVQQEEDSRDFLEIRPWQSTKAVAFHVNAFDTKSFIASRHRSQIFKRLAEKETGHCISLRLSELEAEGGSHHVIQSSSIGDIARDAPLLLLDADADPDITERLVPGAEFVSIQSPPIADIVQISDLTL